jgi:SAM-dependent methyltransferase
MEPAARELYHSILASLPMRGRCMLLHVGCGSGLFCQMSAAIGATPAGVDRSADLVALARWRLPAADFQVADLAELPHPAARFDVVAIAHPQKGVSVRAMLREARRVARPGAAIVLAAFGPPLHCDLAVVMAALAAGCSHVPGPWDVVFELCGDGALERAATEGELSPVLVEDVDCVMIWPDRETAMRALLCSDAAAVAVERVGEREVRDSLGQALDRLKVSQGRYRYANRYRYVIAATEVHGREAA